MACRILVPQPGIEPTPPALEVQSLSCWTAREVQMFFSRSLATLLCALVHSDELSAEPVEFSVSFVVWSVSNDVTSSFTRPFAWRWPGLQDDLEVDVVAPLLSDVCYCFIIWGKCPSRHCLIASVLGVIAIFYWLFSSIYWDANMLFIKKFMLA